MGFWSQISYWLYHKIQPIQPIQTIKIPMKSNWMPLINDNINKHESVFLKNKTKQNKNNNNHPQSEW